MYLPVLFWDDGEQPGADSEATPASERSAGDDHGVIARSSASNSAASASRTCSYEALGGALIPELVRLNPNLIAAPGPPARQARDATSTIPVVFLLGADRLRPGGQLRAAKSEPHRNPD